MADLSPEIQRSVQLASSSPCDRRVNLLIVHHTASPQTAWRGQASINQIRKQHVEDQGWNDIGYHFIISPDGKVWTGRPLGLEGAHTLGWNTNSVGIALVGNFETEHPTRSQTGSAGALLWMLMERFGLHGGHIGTHKDFNSTLCPGRNVTRRTVLNWIRRFGSFDYRAALIKERPTPSPRPTTEAGVPVDVPSDGSVIVLPPIDIRLSQGQREDELPDGERLAGAERNWNQETWGVHQWDFDYDKWKRENAFLNNFVRIGNSNLLVAPSGIEVTESQKGEDSIAMRETSTLPHAAWRTPKYITIQFDIPSRIDTAHSTWADLQDLLVNYSAEAELRKLFIQCRVAPFLPISWGDRVVDNPHLPDIDAIAVQQLVINTVPSAPNVYSITIVGMQFNWQYYLKDPVRTRFEEFFVWPVFDKWIDTIAEEQMPQVPYPGEFQISIADESVLGKMRKVSDPLGRPTGQMVSQERIDTLLRGANSISQESPLAPDSKVAEYERVVRRERGSGLQLYEGRAEGLNPLRAGRYTLTRLCPETEWILQDPELRREYLSLIEDVSSSGSYATVARIGFLPASGVRYSRSGNPLEIIERVVPMDLVEKMESPSEALRTGWLVWYEGERSSLRTSFAERLRLKAGRMREQKDAEEARTPQSSDGAPQRKNVLQDDSAREILTFPSLEITAIQIILTNILSAQTSENEILPVIQSWGGPLIELSIAVSSKVGLGVLEDALARARALQTTFGPHIPDPTGLEPGFWKVSERLTNILGLKWGIPTSLNRTTIEGVPRGEQGSLTIGMFIPNPASLLMAGMSGVAKEKAADFDWGRFLRYSGTLNRTTGSFEKIILQQIEPEMKLRLVPLYPDMYLPTWRTVELWNIAKVNLPEKRGFFAEPDFYINAVDPFSNARYINIKGVLDSVDTGAADVTWTSRLESGSVTTTIDSREEEVGGFADEEERADIEVLDANFDIEDEGLMNGEYVITESPYGDPGVLPLNAAVKGAFHDFTYQGCFGRLAGAFPTMLVSFYRDGKWLGVKRLWDQFYGKVPITQISVAKSMENPADTAVIGIGASISGIAGRDLTQTGMLDPSDELMRVTRDQGEIRRNNMGSLGLLAFGLNEWIAENREAEGMDLSREANLNILAEKWEDLSNALVLAAGTRVNIRLGYGSDIERLPSIFNGTISEVESDPSGLSIIASGDGVELLKELFLSRIANKGEDDGEFDEVKAEWAKISPRKWILGILGSFNGGMINKLRNILNINVEPDPVDQTVENTERRVGENRREGTEVETNPELGALTLDYVGPFAPRPEGDGVGFDIPGQYVLLLPNSYGIEHFGKPIPMRAGAGRDSFFRINIGKYNFVDATELGQNIFSTVRGQMIIDQYSDELVVPGQEVERVYTTTGEPGEEIEGRSERRNRYITREKAYKINIYERTFWDVLTELARLTPGFICATHPFGMMRSTLFFGKPHYPLSYGYTDVETSGEVTGWKRWIRNYNSENKGMFFSTADSRRIAVPEARELLKTFSQCHFAHARFGLLRNRITLDGSDVANKGVLYWKDDNDQLKQTGRKAELRMGEQAIVVQIDNDIIPEEVREIRIIVPFSYSWWTSNLASLISLGMNTSADTIALNATVAYGFSTLAEHVRTMYDGSLILLGNSSIKPWDYVKIQDDINLITGLCQVRAVTHSAEPGLGFLTDVTPGAIAWTSKSDNMRPTIGINAVAGQVSSILSLADAIQKNSISYRKNVTALMEAVMDAVETVKEKTSNPETRKKAMRVLNGAKGGGEAWRIYNSTNAAQATYRNEECLRNFMRILKHGGSKEASTLTARLVGKIAIRAGEPGPWMGGFSQSAVVGLLEKAMIECNLSEEDPTTFRMLKRSLERVQYFRATMDGALRSMERSTGVDMAAALYGGSTYEEAVKTTQRAQEDAEAKMDWVNYNMTYVGGSRRGTSRGWLMQGGSLVAAGLAATFWPASVFILLANHTMGIIGTKLEELEIANQHACMIMPLMRAGREYQTGLTGHRGALVGESGNAIEEMLMHSGIKGGVYRWFQRR